MNDLVFVLYNSKLMERKQNFKKVIDYGTNDISFGDEWLMENDEN